MKAWLKEYWKHNKYVVLIAFILSIATSIIWYKVTNNTNNVEVISYNDFKQLVQENKVDTVYYNKSNEWMTITLFNDTTKTMTLEERNKYDGYKDSDKRLVLYPAGDDFRKDLLEKNVNLVLVAEKTSILQTLSNILMIGFPIFILIIMLPMLRSFSNLVEKDDIIQKSDTKFTDIIGHEEILEDLKFITKLIKDPSIGEQVGAKVPKGILLSGDPGCGKTLIAKAIAGEAGVSFIYQNASSFIDRFVGVGAKHVRDLFKLAKKHTPCVIFIDEIDAIGMDRAKNKGGTSENDQTIDALLQAMDGFNGREHIFIIAATNRPDILDPALTRSGRFDRQIIVSKPRDWKVRKELFDHYLAKFTVADNVNTENISKQVTGFTGADIATICNEASIIAVMNKKDAIDRACIEEAIDKKIFKGNRSKKEKYQRDKEIIAYHESGHAVMSYLLGEPIARASIQSTVSGVGGVVFKEDKDSIFQTDVDFENQVLVCYAGRASEEIKFKSVTTGASNDITQATNIMMQYVENYGFDRDFGLLDVSVLSQQHLINSKELTHKLSEMSNKLYDKCKEMLHQNYDLVEKLATKLLEVETLNGQEISELFKAGE